VGERVEQTPTYFYTHKIFVFEEFCDLWNLAAVAKSVRQEQGLRTLLEMMLKKSAPHGKLPNQALSRRQQHIMLDPRAPDNLPTAACDCCLNAREYCGVEQAHPLVVLGLAGTKLKIS
jgi:hypothetical protein